MNMSFYNYRSFAVLVYTGCILKRTEQILSPLKAAKRLKALSVLLIYTLFGYLRWRIHKKDFRFELPERNFKLVDRKLFSSKN